MKISKLTGGGKKLTLKDLINTDTRYTELLQKLGGRA